jgi:hypothetical protein
MCNTDKKVMLINELIKLVLKRRTIIAIVSILTVILFKKPIEIYLSDKVVDGLLSKIKSDLKSDLIFLIITIWIIIYAVLRRKKYIPSKGTWFIIALLGTSYTYYRINTDVWLYTPYSLFEAIKYTDFIFVLALLHMVLTVNYSVRFNKSRRARSKETGDKGFFVDKELTYDEEEDPEDLLGYEGYAENVADKIGETKLERSFAIGINGKWGMGKSSFMGMIKKNLKKDDKNILIHFNPWNSKTPEAILKDFFDTFHGVIQSEYHSLSRLILRYADKLLDLNRTKSTRFIYMVTSLIFGNKPADVLYSTINNTIKKTDKRFIVFIDDLDRLDAKEIFEVLKIIRNTANFKETVFIVAYDRAYVVKALDNLNKCDSHRYLEKIFQLNIDLPYFNKDILRRELYDCLVDVFPDKFKEELSKELFMNNGVGEKYFGDVFINIRDIRRFYNTLILNSSDILEEVSIRDFLLIQILRLKWPLVFDMVKIDILKYFKKSKYTKGLVMCLKKEGNNVCLIDKDIKKYSEKLLVNGSELDNVLRLLHDIFPQEDKLSKISDNSVLYVVKFGLYFSYTLSPYSIPEPIFDWVRKEGVKSLFDLIDTAFANKSVDDLEQKFMRISDFKDIQDFENTIRAIMYLATKYSINNNILIRGYTGYDISDLSDKLDIRNNGVLDNFYSGIVGLEKFRRFVKDIFDSAKSPFLYESRLSYKLCDTVLNTVYDKEVLSKIRIDYFKEYCAQIQYFNLNIWELFHNSEVINYVQETESSYRPEHYFSKESKKIFKDFIYKDPDGFIFSILVRSSRENKKSGTFRISNAVLLIFDKWDCFEREFINRNHSNSLYHAEFKEVYNIFKNNDFYAIKYEFKSIPFDEKKSNEYAIIWRNHLEEIKKGIEEVEYDGDLYRVQFTRDEFVYTGEIVLSDYVFNLELTGENSRSHTNTVVVKDLYHVLTNDDSTKDIIRTKHLEFSMDKNFLLTIKALD